MVTGLRTPTLSVKVKPHFSETISFRPWRNNCSSIPTYDTRTSYKWWKGKGQRSLSGTHISEDKDGFDLPLGRYGILILHTSVLSSRHHSPLWALQGHYFSCGRKAYKILPANWTGSCYVARGVPYLHITSKLPQGTIRHVTETSLVET